MKLLVNFIFIIYYVKIYYDIYVLFMIYIYKILKREFIFKNLIYIDLFVVIEEI